MKLPGVGPEVDGAPPDDASLALLAEEPVELLVGLPDVPLFEASVPLFEVSVPLFEVSVPLAVEPADLPLAEEPVEAEESL